MFSKASNQNGRGNAFMLTWNYRVETEPVFTASEAQEVVDGKYLDSVLDIELLSAQFERTPTTNRLHVQMFTTVKRKYTLSSVIAKVNSVFKDGGLLRDFQCHVTMASSTKTDRYNCFHYCLKDDTRCEKYFVQGRRGDPPVSDVTKRNKKREEVTGETKMKKQRKCDEEKELLEKMRLYIRQEEQPSWMMFTADPDMACQYLPHPWMKKDFDNELLRKRLDNLDCRRKIEEVVVCFGYPGTGKSTYINNHIKEETGAENLETVLWRQPDNKWFGSATRCYENQPYICIEEMDFGHAFDFQLFKVLCDIGHFEPVVLPVKNSTSYSNHKAMYFSTNSHPMTWFKESVKNEMAFQALRRRLKLGKILYFPKWRPDGTSNVFDPEVHTSDREPYFVDITGDMPMNLSEYLQTHPDNLIPGHLKSDIRPTFSRSYDSLKAQFESRRSCETVNEVADAMEIAECNDVDNDVVKEILNPVDLMYKVHGISACDGLYIPE
jgi:hypothetical protein